MKHFDTIIIGGGHNGLVCANYLAKAGQAVIVLEASENFGGLASTRTFFPDFKVNIAHAINQFSGEINSDLHLSKFGYKPSSNPLSNIGLNLEGEHVTVSQDGVHGVSDKDTNSYQQYISSLRQFAKALKPFWMKTIPRLNVHSVKEALTFVQIGLKLKMLGKKDMREFLRIFSLPVRDLMDEFFDSDLLKATLSWDALIGSSQAPRSPNNSILTLLYRMSGEHYGHYSIPEFGVNGLVNALVDSAKNAGVELKLDSRVTKISIDGNRDGLKAVGVKIGDRDKITADRIVSAIDPKQTFIDLVGTECLEIEFSNRINRLRTQGYVAKLHLALSELPKFKGIESPDARLIIASNMDKIEFAWDDAKYGQCPKEPVMEVTIPSIYDQSLAPKGKHVLSANIMYIPYQNNDSWSDEEKKKLMDKLIETLSLYAPGIKDHILHSELLTPNDLERTFNVTGGHWHHTELALDQMLMMRPTYESAQYKTPINGLYVCGAGCHPGGGIMGAAGHNAAKEILT